uniref:Uncharacterized protein n=2 Tax=Pseudomonas marincola TaxID=437900 RepID=A0A653E000_9PSED
MAQLSVYDSDVLWGDMLPRIFCAITALIGLGKRCRPLKSGLEQCQWKLQAREGCLSGVTGAL